MKILKQLLSSRLIMISYLLMIPFSQNLLALDGGSPEQGWINNFEEGRKEAKEKNKNILLYFSGSDWCRPCIQLKTDVFNSVEFKKLAEEMLVTIQFDFPARKNNLLPDKQRQYNERLAEKFNKKGQFPLVVILNPEGRVLGEISGYKKEGPEQYLKTIKALF